jgi:hypothetical protein
MTASAPGSITDAVVGEAGLLATFYLPRDKKHVQALQDRFCRSLELVRKAPGGYSDPAEEAFLIRFEPPSGSPIAHDTSIIQLALNAPDGDDSPWETTREKLEKCIRDIANLKAKTLWGAAGLDKIWGYTLTYQADVDPRVSASEAFEKLRPTVRRLYSPERDLYPLAQDDVAGGRMWLLHTADQGDGPAAATVYVALRTSEETLEAEREAETAFNKVFSGPGAALLMPDLVAHKGYYQKREYSGRNQQKYEADLNTFQGTTRLLLTDLKEQESEVSDKSLRDLTGDYGKLIEMVWDLDNVRISMAQQAYNYVQRVNALGRSPAAIKSNNILDYHHDRIKAASSELELMVTEGRNALQTADPVLRMAQLRTDKAQESRQVGIEAWLAAAGLALALPHLIDYEATRALLSVPLSLLFGLEVPDTEPVRLIVLAVQVIVIAAAAGLAYRRVKGSLNKPGGLPKRTRS